MCCRHHDHFPGARSYTIHIKPDHWSLTRSVRENDNTNKTPLSELPSLKRAQSSIYQRQNEVFWTGIGLFSKTFKSCNTMYHNIFCTSQTLVSPEISVTPHLCRPRYPASFREQSHGNLNEKKKRLAVCNFMSLLTCFSTSQVMNLGLHSLSHYFCHLPRGFPAVSIKKVLKVAALL